MPMHGRPDGAVHSNLPCHALHVSTQVFYVFLRFVGKRDAVLRVRDLNLGVCHRASVVLVGALAVHAMAVHAGVSRARCRSGFRFGCLGTAGRACAREGEQQSQGDDVLGSTGAVSHLQCSSRI